jgi:hypothetical protein
MAAEMEGLLSTILRTKFVGRAGALVPGAL